MECDWEGRIHGDGSGFGNVKFQPALRRKDHANSVAVMLLPNLEVYHWLLRHRGRLWVRRTSS